MSGYGMQQRVRIADMATEDIVMFLESIPSIVGVLNVEGDSYYQEQDIDLVAVSKKDDKTECIKIEIKGDTYHRTGNFFFETISNKEKGTEGCFLYTTADFLFYYYVAEKELYMLPVKETRAWYLANSKRFNERETKTSVRGTHYTTVGKLVPRQMVLDEVEGVTVYNLSDYIDTEKQGE